MQIKESGMDFGNYSEEQVYHIEVSGLYQTLRPKGIKCCEFILLRESKILLIEAKTSCPKEIEASSSEERKLKYNEYIDDICLKMKHTIQLYACVVLKRLKDESLPKALADTDLSKYQIKPILVVKMAEKEWLPSLADVLNRKIINLKRIWNLDNLLVLNEDLARRKGLVI